MDLWNTNMHMHTGIWVALQIANESVPKITINNTIKNYFLRCNQHLFGYFKP